MGEQAGTVGVATVDGGASWTTSTSLRVGQNGTGTLFVGAGSTVKSTGPHVLATSSISFGNNAGSLGVGTVSGAGAVLNTGGDRLTVGNSGTGGLTVSAGATVLAGAVYTDVEAALSVGGSVGGSGGLVITGAGSSVVVTGQAVVAGNIIGAGAVAGGTGGISATLGGALYEQQGLTLFSGGRLSTDATGLIDIGGTAGRAGATTVEAGSTLTDLGGVVAGTLTGAGTVLVNGFDSVLNSAGGLTYKFGAAHSTLALSAQSGGSALVNFSQGDAIEFVGQTLTPAFSGSVMTAGGAAFGLYGAPAGTHYLTTHDMAGDTFVTALSAANDFNGDGKSDDVLQNDNGTILIETTPGGPGTAVSGYLVGAPGGSWHVVGTGDFNGDGMPDILVQNTNGAVVDYIMNGTTPTASYLLAGAGTGYHVRGTGDFNGDGKTDIVVQNDDGSVAIWTTDGTKVTTATLVSNPGPGYTVEGVGDFNGDGQPDLLLQNTNSALVVYTMNGTNYQSGAVIGTPGVGWSVAGTGTDGTGKADILLHNDNGADVVYNTNGKTVTGATLVANPGPGYTGAVAGLDLNGDGTTDVLLQNTNSFIVDFGLNSAGAPVTATGITTPGVGWHAIGNTPIEFIDGTGSTFNLAATAGADQFDLTSFATGLHQISGFDPATDTVALSAATFGSYAALQNAMQIQPYAGGTFVGLGTGSALVIQGVTPSQISASDFVFR